MDLCPKSNLPTTIHRWTLHLVQEGLLPQMIAARNKTHKYARQQTTEARKDLIATRSNDPETAEENTVKAQPPATNNTDFRMDFTALNDAFAGIQPMLASTRKAEETLAPHYPAHVPQKDTRASTTGNTPRGKSPPTLPQNCAPL